MAGKSQPYVTIPPVTLTTLATTLCMTTNWCQSSSSSCSSADEASSSSSSSSNSNAVSKDLPVSDTGWRLRSMCSMAEAGAVHPTDARSRAIAMNNVCAHLK